MIYEVVAKLPEDLVPKLLIKNADEAKIYVFVFDSVRHKLQKVRHDSWVWFVVKDSRSRFNDGYCSIEGAISAIIEKGHKVLQIDTEKEFGEWIWEKE